MLSLQELSIFLEAAETGCFSHAGRRLHLSQPAISQSIRNLERRFGTTLFIRHGRNVRLSETGQALVPMARELLTTARRLEETIGSLEGKVIGEINIGCSTASGKYLLPNLIARFRSIFPEVRVNVLIGDRRRVYTWLDEGKVSLAVSSKPMESADYEHQFFYRDEVALIVPPTHAWADYPRIFPDDLLEAPIIMREETSGTRQALFEALRQRDINPELLNVVMILGNAEAIEMAVGEGIGMAFISTLAARRGLEVNRVVQVEVEGMSIHKDLFVARNRSLPNTRALNELWEFISQEGVIPQQQQHLTEAPEDCVAEAV